MLKKSTPEKLSFAEWQFILTSGNKDASDQVWSAIKGKPVQLVADVVDAARDSLKLAGSADDIDAKKADITLTLKTPLAAGSRTQGGGATRHPGRSQRVHRRGRRLQPQLHRRRGLEGIARSREKARPVHTKPSSSIPG